MADDSPVIQSDPVPSILSDPSIPSSSDTNSAIDISSSPLEQPASSEASASASVTTPSNETNSPNDPNSSISSSETNRPDSTISADSSQDTSQQIKQSADTTAQQIEQAASAESKQEIQQPESTPLAVEPIIEQDTSEASASATPVRPESTNPADSSLKNTSQAEESKRPELKQMADEKPTDLQIEASSSAQPTEEILSPPEPPLSAEAPAKEGELPLSPTSSEESTSSVSPDLRSLSDSTTLPNQEDTSINQPQVEATQVQSEPSDDVSKIDAQQVASPSASFNPKPPEAPQEAPLADKTSLENTENSQKSFGDLILTENQPSTTSIPSTPSDPLTSSSSPLSSSTEIPASESPSNQKSFGNLLQDTPVSEIKTEQKEDDKPKELDPPKSFSFGDLLKETQDIKAKIPEDLFEIKDTPQEVISPSQPTPPQQQTSPTSPQSPLQPQPFANSSEPTIVEKVVEKIVEKPVEVIKEAQPRTDSTSGESSTGVPVEKIVEKEVVKEIKVVDQQDLQKQISSHTQTIQQNSRILANQARQKRREDNLSKIMNLVRKEGKVNNQDIRDLLHVGQSTVSDYLKILVNQGVLKLEGKGKAIYYHL